MQQVFWNEYYYLTNTGKDASHLSIDFDIESWEKISDWSLFHKSFMSFLADSPVEQVKILGEMPLYFCKDAKFDNTYKASNHIALIILFVEGYGLYYDEFDIEPNVDEPDLIRQLLFMFDSDLINFCDTSLWGDDALFNHPFWQKVRNIASQIISKEDVVKYRRDKPFDLRCFAYSYLHYTSDYIDYYDI